jgi:aspartate aminotransferase
MSNFRGLILNRETMSMALPSARTGVRSLLPSAIREVANSAMGRDGVLPFWFGESDQPTPQFICDAATASLQQGRTFYTPNLGLGDLREAIAGYLSHLHCRQIAEDRIAVTSSGVSALMLAAQLIVNPGDRIVAVTPLWPNITEIPRILGAETVRVPLDVRDNRWTLDLDRLLAALTPDTRLLLLNSPNNPTGWTIDAADQRAILEHCRQHGIWIIADDVYERLVFRPDLRSAPSFVALADPADRVIGVNSFSKAWCMTGWRLGWLVLPPSLLSDLSKLIEYNTSCAPEFIQRAGIAALAGGEPHIAALRAQLAARRNSLLHALTDIPGVQAPASDGAMYAFFRVASYTDSLALAKEMIARVGLGLAPGIAFGPEGSNWMRWCYAADAVKLDEGIQRMHRFLAA